MALVAAIAALEWWAWRELQREDALTTSTRDRSPVTYFIDDTRLHPFVAPDNTNALRISIIGDSITHGANCFFGDSFGMRLERLMNLNPGVRPVRVDVYAEAGTGTFEQRRLLSQSFKEGSNDVVVLVYSLNDTEDWSNAKEFIEWRKAADPLEPGHLLRRATNVSHFAEWAFRLARNRHIQAGTMYYYQKLYDPSYSGVRRVESGMRYFRDSCRTNGASLMVVLLPIMFSSSDDSLLFAHDLVAHMTAKLDIPTLDMWPDFRDKTPLRMTTVPGEDGHLSEIAHRIVSEGIFEFLLANGMVNPANEPMHMNTTPKKFEAVRLAPRRVAPPKGQ
jgi:hypothetical protein